ncbi:outer membrane lipoprotein chaperone LolA [Thalassotalea sp. PLHSN55]|uniref:outer membrane lipoprotein chaperone LolA n=1 Tax=Thalassotalea sp. PLHSN55 TaxID=3435888 RepID=UPI003F84C095
MLFFKKTLTFISVSALLSSSIIALPSGANETNNSIVTIEQPIADGKSRLIEKLDKINYLTANFSQKVFDEEGNALQEGTGEFVLSKPNKVRWHTQTPDETLIVSDGDTLWFFDPFIEQASAHTLANAIANTPILLLTNNDKSLWNNFEVKQIQTDAFEVLAKDVNSQVKSLSLYFTDDKISIIKIKDSTGQLSTINLTDVNISEMPEPSLFQFSLPEGVELDDQR